MFLLRLLIAFAAVLFLSDCRSKSNAAAKEISEAGYTMSSEGWFSAVRSNDISIIRKMVDVGFDPKIMDAATGRRYVAKPGQKFNCEDGREFIVNDVRPGQIVIEETTSGEVRTLRLRGSKG